VVFRVLEEMKKIEVKVLWGEEWQIEGDHKLKQKKNICTKERRIKNGDNPVASWCTSSQT